MVGLDEGEQFVLDDPNENGDLGDDDYQDTCSANDDDESYRAIMDGVFQTTQPAYAHHVDRLEHMILGSKGVLESSKYARVLQRWIVPYKVASRNEKRKVARQVIRELVSEGCNFYQTHANKQFLVSVNDASKIENRVMLDLRQQLHRVETGELVLEEPLQQTDADGTQLAAEDPVDAPEETTADAVPPAQDVARQEHLQNEPPVPHVNVPENGSAAGAEVPRDDVSSIHEVSIAMGGSSSRQSSTSRNALEDKGSVAPPSEQEPLDYAVPPALCPLKSWSHRMVAEGDNSRTKSQDEAHSLGAHTAHGQAAVPGSDQGNANKEAAQFPKQGTHGTDTSSRKSPTNIGTGQVAVSSPRRISYSVTDALPLLPRPPAALFAGEWPQPKPPEAATKHRTTAGKHATGAKRRSSYSKPPLSKKSSDLPPPRRSPRKKPLEGGRVPNVPPAALLAAASIATMQRSVPPKRTRNHGGGSSANKKKKTNNACPQASSGSSGGRRTPAAEHNPLPQSLFGYEALSKVAKMGSKGDKWFQNIVTEMQNRLHAIESRMLMMELQNRRLKLRLAGLEDEEERRGEAAIQEATALAANYQPFASAEDNSEDEDEQEMEEEEGYKYTGMSWS